MIIFSTIYTCKTREGELWNFNPDFAASGEYIHRFHGLPDDQSSGHSHEIVIQSLGYKGERPRHPDVTFDDFKLVVLPRRFHLYSRFSSPWRRIRFTLAINCMLKGPVTPRDAAIAFDIILIFVNVSALMSCGGVTRVASPE